MSLMNTWNIGAFGEVQACTCGRQIIILGIVIANIIIGLDEGVKDVGVTGCSVNESVEKVRG